MTACHRCRDMVGPEALRPGRSLARREGCHATWSRFDLPAPAWVHLEVFDLQGRRVAKLADEFLPPGPHAREWSGVAAEGGRVRPGMYVYRIRAGEHADQRKLVLMP